jgi:Protocatechuate 3,4-dioxygenase beta subunit N terminal
VTVAAPSDIVLPDDPSFGPEVQVDYPGYRSTRLRAPKRPLVTSPEELHSLAGPVFGDDLL